VFSVARSGDKGALPPVLPTRGIPEWSLLGFTKQSLEAVFSETEGKERGPPEAGD
jgi:hypothetical protein